MHTDLGLMAFHAVAGLLTNAAPDVPVASHKI